MIQTVLRREFVIICDGCGRHGGATDTPEAARNQARVQGWQPAVSFAGACFVTTWQCPACRAREEPPTRIARPALAT